MTIIDSISIVIKGVKNLWKIIDTLESLIADRHTLNRFAFFEGKRSNASGQRLFLDVTRNNGN